jgi:hypothetical protein
MTLVVATIHDDHITMVADSKVAQRSVGHVRPSILRCHACIATRLRSSDLLRAIAEYASPHTRSLV